MSENTPTLFNVYCDESCHLESSHIPTMVLGAVWCPQSICGKISRDIRQIKEVHGLKRDFEIKWTKVSPAKQAFYCALVDYFFSNPSLQFRGLVIPDKNKLDHEKFGQNHNIFYYKMFFYVLRNIISTDYRYHIYLDIKDTHGREKIDLLKNTLHTAKYDFDRRVIGRIQHIRSHEAEQLQLADLFIGALGYVQRGLSTNQGKLAVIERIKYHTNKSLLKSTLPSESKFNLFVWEAQ